MDNAQPALEDALEPLFTDDMKMRPEAAGTYITLRVRVGYPGSRVSDLLFGDQKVPVDNDTIRAALIHTLPQPADPQQASDLVERVTQKDRDAALNLLDQQKLHEHETGTFRCWDKVVEAFAHHRHAAIAALTPARSAQTSELVERLLNRYRVGQDIEEEAAARIKALEDEVERLNRVAQLEGVERKSALSLARKHIAKTEAAEAALATARADAFEAGAKAMQRETIEACLKAVEGQFTAYGAAAAIRNLANQS